MYSAIAANKRKTVILVLIFIATLGLLGWLFSQTIGSPSVFTGVLIFAVGYSLIGYYASAKIALAMSGAKPVEKSDAPKLYRTVENLAITAGIPTPKVYIINDPAPNAFATGRDPEHSVVAVTTGLLEMLDDNELEGVIAHELSHIQNYDIRVMAMVLVLVSIIAFVSDMFLRMNFFGFSNDNNSRSGSLLSVFALVAALIAPLVAVLLKMAVSRRREFLADASGVLLTRYPDGLASALAKIESYGKPMKKAHTATAHLFISNPLGGKGKASRQLASLFSTHPPTHARIEALGRMEENL